MYKILSCTLLSGLACAASAQASENGQIATIACSFDEGQSALVERIEIKSVREFLPSTPPAPQGLTLFYRNGNVESVAPVERTDEFGRLVYPATIEFKKGQAFFPATLAGDVFVNFECFYAPGIPWDRCQSQGSGAHGAFASVQIRMGDDVAHFVGQDLCTRSVTVF